MGNLSLYQYVRNRRLLPAGLLGTLLTATTLSIPTLAQIENEKTFSLSMTLEGAFYFSISLVNDGISSSLDLSYSIGDLLSGEDSERRSQFDLARRDAMKFLKGEEMSPLLSNVIGSIRKQGWPNELQKELQQGLLSNEELALGLIRHQF